MTNTASENIVNSTKEVEETPREQEQTIGETMAGIDGTETDKAPELDSESEDEAGEEVATPVQKICDELVMLNAESVLDRSYESAFVFSLVANLISHYGKLDMELVSRVEDEVRFSTVAEKPAWSKCYSLILDSVDEY
jgi:hypothetical protein